jgi:hypothetical protein
MTQTNAIQFLTDKEIAFVQTSFLQYGKELFLFFKMLQKLGIFCVPSK